jgi:hypothetical protein
MNVKLGLHMAAVAQLVVAPDCGSGCRGFKSHQPPQLTPTNHRAVLRPSGNIG